MDFMDRLIRKFGLLYLCRLATFPFTFLGFWCIEEIRILLSGWRYMGGGLLGGLTYTMGNFLASLVIALFFAILVAVWPALGRTAWKMLYVTIPLALLIWIAPIVADLNSGDFLPIDRSSAISFAVFWSLEVTMFYLAYRYLLTTKSWQKVCAEGR